MGSIGETFGSVLGEAFPERDVEERGLAGPSWNEQNETARVTFADGETVFLKIATDGDGSRIRRERATIAHVDAHCDVAVPSVIESEVDGAVPYLVTAPLSGRRLLEVWSDASSDERREAARRVGTALAEIHSRTFERHGHIVGGDGTELALETGTWTDVLAGTVERMTEHASTDRFEHCFDEVTAAIEANRETLDDAPASLLHCDPAKPNLFDCPATIGVIDWEIAHVGDPVRGLNRAEAQLLDADQQLVAALREGYERRAGSLPDGFDERAPVYDAVWHLSKLSVFDKYVEFIDEPPAEAAASAQAEMDRRLDAIR